MLRGLRGVSGHSWQGLTSGQSRRGFWGLATVCFFILGLLTSVCSACEKHQATHLGQGVLFCTYVTLHYNIMGVIS